MLDLKLRLRLNKYNMFHLSLMDVGNFKGFLAAHQKSLSREIDELFIIVMFINAKKLYKNCLITPSSNTVFHIGFMAQRTGYSLAQVHQSCYLFEFFSEGATPRPVGASRLAETRQQFCWSARSA